MNVLGLGVFATQNLNQEEAADHLILPMTSVSITVEVHPPDKTGGPQRATIASETQLLFHHTLPNKIFPTVAPTLSII